MKQLRSLAVQVATPAASARESEDRAAEALRAIAPQHLPSARSLVHYLALRRHALRELQDRSRRSGSAWAGSPSLSTRGARRTLRAVDVIPTGALVETHRTTFLHSSDVPSGGVLGAGVERGALSRLHREEPGAARQPHLPGDARRGAARHEALTLLLETGAEIRLRPLARRQLYCIGKWLRGRSRGIRRERCEPQPWIGPATPLRYTSPGRADQELPTSRRMVPGRADRTTAGGRLSAGPAQQVRRSPSATEVKQEFRAVDPAIASFVSFVCFHPVTGRATRSLFATVIRYRTGPF